MEEDKIYSFDITKDPPQSIEVDKEHILYGDSVTKDALIVTGDESYVKIEDLFKEVTYRIGDKEYYVPSEEVLCLSYDWRKKACVFKPIRYVMRHKTDKKIYRVQSNNITYVDVTEDHSIITQSNQTNELECVKPQDLDGSLVVHSDDTNVEFRDHYYVKEVEYDDYVYDIEVEDTHLFFANDILVHNTDSIGVDGSFVFDETATVDEVVDFGDRIADTTNERFPEFLQTVFNVQPENTRFLKTERESAFSKAFFQAKKRYFQLIVDDEGDRVDHKEKIMGLEIKKTSASQVTREYLYKLCRCILDEGTREAALDLVDRLHEDFYNRSLQEIATPTAVKTLNAYERGQKNIPWHVKAAMAYNDLCGPNDPQIRSGDKIKVINVDPKYQKTQEPIKRIAFPIDVDSIPEFVYDFRINCQVEWEKVEKYLNNYLASMGWDQRSYQKDHTSNLFSIQ